MSIQRRIEDGNIHVSGDGPDSSVFIAENPTNKLGHFGTLPVIQPTAAGQADQGVMTTAGANTGTAGAGLTLIVTTQTVDQSANIMDDFIALQEDIAALDVLLTEMRTVLVNLGLMKGS